MIDSLGKGSSMSRRRSSSRSSAGGVGGGVRKASLAAGLALVLAVTCGCSVEVGSDGATEDPVAESFAGDVLADSVNAKLEADLGSKLDPGTMQCPALKQEVGAQVTCVRSSERNGIYATIDVTVELTASQGGSFDVHYEVAPEPTTLGMRGDKIEKAITKQAVKFYGAPASTVECPDLKGVEGGEVTCAVTVRGAEEHVVATAIDVNRAEAMMHVRLRELNPNG